MVRGSDAASYLTGRSSFCGVKSSDRAAAADSRMPSRRRPQLFFAIGRRGFRRTKPANQGGEQELNRRSGILILTGFSYLRRPCRPWSSAAGEAKRSSTARGRKAEATRRGAASICPAGPSLCGSNSPMRSSRRGREKSNWGRRSGGGGGGESAPTRLATWRTHRQ